MNMLVNFMSQIYPQNLLVISRKPLCNSQDIDQNNISEPN